MRLQRSSRRSGRAMGQSGKLHITNRKGLMMLHTIRTPTSWQPWEDMFSAIRGTTFVQGSVDCASIGNNLHVVAIDLNTKRIRHTIRFQNSWQPWGDVTANVSGAPANFQVHALTCAGIGSDLHVVVYDDFTGKLWHTIRWPGAWQDWGDVKAAVPGMPGGIGTILGCAGIGNDLHLIIADGLNGTIGYTIRFPGSWQAWEDVTGAIPLLGTPGLGSLYDVSCAGIGQNLHLVI